MKKILSITIAAAALLSIASCQKMEPANNNNESEKTVRVITGEFSNDGTKTTLNTDGKTPLWSVGDVIRVLNGSKKQDITLAAENITNGGRKISFSTTLTGMLYAVYPASATTMTKCTDGNITFTIPAVQDGTFGSANICVASGDGETPNRIYFSNATAVVEMTVATGVVGTQFAAANNIAGDMTVAMGNKGTISSATTTSLSSNTISVSDTKAPTGSKFYLAIAPVETGAITISCNTTSKSGSVNKGTKTLVKNKIYAMDNSGMTINTDIDLTGQKGVLNGQEYVLIKAKYDGDNDSYLKWATQNLAVTLNGKAKYNDTDYVNGDYFQWAAYYGYTYSSDPAKYPPYIIYTGFKTSFSGFTYRKKEDNTTPYSFDHTNAPYGGSYYSKYKQTDHKTILELSDDVANIVLGSTWRMPTGGSTGEFKAMYGVTYWAWHTTKNGYYVFKPGLGTTGSAGNFGTYGTGDDYTKALLFFPAAGYASNETGDKPLHVFGINGCYWASSVDIDNEFANDLRFAKSEVSPDQRAARYCGMNVRPVSN